MATQMIPPTPTSAPLHGAYRGTGQSQGTAAPAGYNMTVRPVSRVIRRSPVPPPQPPVSFPYHWLALVTVAGLLGTGWLLGGGLVMLGVVMGWITLGMLFMVRREILQDLNRLLG